MVNKRFPGTTNKPCLCHQGQPCVGCKRRKLLKPQVYLEEPRRLPVPICINHYKHETVNRATEDRWPFRRKKNESTKKTGICPWFKNRRALKQLKAEHEKEIKRLEWDPEFRAQMEQKYNYIQQMQKQELENYKQEKQRKKEKSKKFKFGKDTPMCVGKAASAKPCATSKYAAVKTYNRHMSFNERFVNCFYRFCCQLYCCFTFLVVIGFAIILLLP